MDIRLGTVLTNEQSVLTNSLLLQLLVCEVVQNIFVLNVVLLVYLSTDIFINVIHTWLWEFEIRER